MVWQENVLVSFFVIGMMARRASAVRIAIISLAHERAQRMQAFVPMSLPIRAVPDI
jgi:hypothetical protein